MRPLAADAFHPAAALVETARRPNGRVPQWLLATTDHSGWIPSISAQSWLRDDNTPPTDEANSASGCVRVTTAVRSGMWGLQWSDAFSLTGQCPRRCPWTTRPGLPPPQGGRDPRRQFCAAGVGGYKVESPNNIHGDPALSLPQPPSGSGHPSGRDASASLAGARRTTTCPQFLIAQSR